VLRKFRAGPRALYGCSPEIDIIGVRVVASELLDTIAVFIGEFSILITESSGLGLDRRSFLTFSF
jgi:hypothetical protein